MNPGRFTTATLNGRTYTIPEMWLAGFCSRWGYTIPEAVQWWAFQTELAERGL